PLAARRLSPGLCGIRARIRQAWRRGRFRRNSHEIAHAKYGPHSRSYRSRWLRRPDIPRKGHRGIGHRIYSATRAALRAGRTAPRRAHRGRGGGAEAKPKQKWKSASGLVQGSLRRTKQRLSPLRGRIDPPFRTRTERAKPRELALPSVRPLPPVHPTEGAAAPSRPTLGSRTSPRSTEAETPTEQAG